MTHRTHFDIMVSLLLASLLFVGATRINGGRASAGRGTASFCPSRLSLLRSRQAILALSCSAPGPRCAFIFAT